MLAISVQELLCFLSYLEIKLPQMLNRRHKMTSHGTGKLIELNTRQAQYPPLSASPIPIKNLVKTETTLKKTKEMLKGKNKIKITWKVGELLS